MIHFLNTCCICCEPIDQGVWRCSVCDRRYRNRQLRVVVSEPLHNDPQAVVAELLIALHLQGYRVATAAQIERASRQMPTGSSSKAP